MIGQQRYCTYLTSRLSVCSVWMVDADADADAPLSLSLSHCLSHSSLSHPLSSSFSLNRTRAILPESRQGQSDKRKKVSAGRS